MEWDKGYGKGIRRRKWQPTLQAGIMEPSRVAIGVEFIGGWHRYELIVTLLWWFIIVGVEKR